MVCWSSTCAPWRGLGERSARLARAVGDVLTLGAPMGEMEIDKDSQRDLLLLAGGTGLAPLKAIIDEMTRWNTARRVTLFFGVRRPATSTTWARCTASRR